ncbi:MAG TPA: cupin domain-containing protein [Flavobacteriales bacterium]|nr:cupin domain-containing protein [Flavobacteriales bacterium]
MSSVKEYIESGILEMYLLGLASEVECAEVEQMAAQHPEVRNEMEVIAVTIEKQAMETAVEPHENMKPLVLATFDYMKRIYGGEQVGFPAELNATSKASDYNQWLTREDLSTPGDFENIYARIIGHTPEMTTAILWIKQMAPEEVHTNEHEKFLILEGTCDIVVNGKVHSLVPGDYFAIPLHADHHVKVTSSIPCKAILQRVAA